MIRIGHAAIYGANGGALGLFVKAGALGAFAGYDIIKFVGNRFF
jgi:hypothetical protein